MKTRLVAFASTIVAVFYAAGAAWKPGNSQAPLSTSTTQGVTQMKIRLVAFASTIVAVFYAAGAAWKLSDFASTAFPLRLPKESLE